MCTMCVYLLSRESGQTKRRKVDDWDAQYDMGKVKKVKSKRGGSDVWQEGVNVFMKASGRDKHRGFGGKRANQQYKRK